MESKKTDWLLVLIFIASIINLALLIFYGNKILNLISDNQISSQNIVADNSNDSDVNNVESKDCCDTNPQQYRRCELYGTVSEDWRYHGQKRYVCANGDGTYSSCERNLGDCSCDSGHECAW